MALSPCNSTTDLYQRELVEHGSVSFPIACYADDLTTQTVPWHWHDEMEYAIVTEGTPEILLENMKIVLYPGEGIFINAKALHAVESMEFSSKGALHSAVFHPRLVGGNMESVFWQTLIQPLLSNTGFRYIVLKPEVDWQNRMLDCFHNAWKAISDETFDYENEARYLLTKALNILHKNSSMIAGQLSEQEQLEAERIRLMLEYIEDHYKEEITIREIASRVSVSDSACLRCFNKMLGTTPIQYVKQLRLEKASLLLRTTLKPVKEVALECGFNDFSYFTKSFRLKNGRTPKEYQRIYLLKQM